MISKSLHFLTICKCYSTNIMTEVSRTDSTAVRRLTFWLMILWPEHYSVLAHCQAVGQSEFQFQTQAAGQAEVHVLTQVRGTQSHLEKSLTQQDLPMVITYW